MCRENDKLFGFSLFIHLNFLMNRNLRKGVDLRRYLYNRVE